MNPPVPRAVPTRKPGRGNLLSALALALSFAAAAIPASAQYTTKPIRIIVPFPAGGTADIMARVVGQKMTETWGQQVLIDNRSGAGGNIAADLAAKSAPDGYTLFLCTVGTHAVHQTLYEKLPFDPIKDFSAVAYIAGVPNVVVVHPSIPVKSVKELIGFIKARPGRINFGSAGTGSSVHMSGEMLKVMAGLDMTHIPCPAAVPRDIVSKLNAEVMRIVGLEDVKRNLASQGAYPLAMTPDEFGAFMKAETAKWAKVVKASGARAD